MLNAMMQEMVDVHVELTPEQQYAELLQQTLSIIQMRYNEKLNELHYTNGYGLKPMFADKYSIAYTACLDDKALGEENPVVNASVYQDGVLINKDFTFDEFLELYRSVKTLYRNIEKIYQTYLAEISQHPTEERLHYIIEHPEFE